MLHLCIVGISNNSHLYTRNDIAAPPLNLTMTSHEFRDAQEFVYQVEQFVALLLYRVEIMISHFLVQIGRFKLVGQTNHNRKRSSELMCYVGKERCSHAVYRAQSLQAL